MKKYKTLSMMTAVMMLISALSVGTQALASPEPMIDKNLEGLTSYSSASWNQAFNSESEITDASDIVIHGVVVDTEPELRHDMVFTRNYISVTKVSKGEVQVGDVIIVVQTGGTFSKYSTPAISEIPLLETNKEYELYLTLTEYSKTYGQYYLISGGYQGVLEIQDNGSLMTLSNQNTVFNQKDTVLSESGSIDTRATTPAYSYYWNKNSLVVYVQGNIRDRYHANTRVGICNGIHAWADKTDSPSTSITISTVDADVCVYMYDYGATGWDAETTTYVDPNTNICDYSRMTVNAHYLTNYYDMEGLWQAIACHEFGHTLGLSHNDSGTASIMRSVTTDYFNYRGLLPRYKVPKQADITPINAKY